MCIINGPRGVSHTSCVDHECLSVGVRGTHHLTTLKTLQNWRRGRDEVKLRSAEAVARKIRKIYSPVRVNIV